MAKSTFGPFGDDLRGSGGAVLSDMPAVLGAFADGASLWHEAGVARKRAVLQAKVDEASDADDVQGLEFEINQLKQGNSGIALAASALSIGASAAYDVPSEHAGTADAVVGGISGGLGGILRAQALSGKHIKTRAALIAAVLATQLLSGRLNRNKDNDAWRLGLMVLRRVL